MRLRRGLPLRRATALGCAFGALLALSCSRGGSEETKTASAPATKPRGADLPKFVEIRERTGISFVHESGMSPKRYMMETLGGGVAVIDFDGDGLQDLYFVDSGMVPARTGEQSPGGSKLYKNVGHWRFEDVTERAGVRGRGYGMGAVVGDYDADGRPDLYVTCYGSNVLFHNDGDGVFSDVTKSAGVDDPRWSTGAAFLDFDQDGRLDLFVQNYLAYRVESHLPYTIGELPAYPVPDLFDPEPCSLFRNQGDGTFEDVSRASGIAASRGKGLGVLVADFDGDGDSDVYCANDTTANHLFENQGDGRFQEIGLASGAGYSAEGREMSGMGVDAADINGDQALDIVVTNFQREPNSIYRNEGELAFTEISSRSGTALASLATLGFGARFLDFDCDGVQDLVVANGHIFDNAPAVDPGTTFAQPPLLFHGLGPSGVGNGRFEDVAAGQPAEFAKPHVARGLAAADFDEDGDLDLVFANLGAAPSVFENQGGNAKAWVSVRAVGTKRDSTAIGARVRVEAGGKTQLNDVRSGGSYLSQSDLRVFFGLDDAKTVDRIVVRWPGGATEEARDLPARAHYVFVEGKGLVR